MKAWKLPVIAGLMTSAGVNAIETEGVNLGSGVTLLPSAELTISDNDNIYSQPSSGEEVSSTITRLTPAVGVKADLGATDLMALARFEMGQYSRDDNDDYLDQLFQAGITSELNARNEIAFSVRINQAHDDRGSGTAEGAAALLIEDPDEYDETVFNLKYFYGSDISLLNLEAYAEQYDKEYQNNRLLTSDRDYDKATAGAKLKVRVSPATHAVLQAYAAEINYDSDSSIYADGTEYRLLAGASWDVTGKTTGEVKLGLADRDFEDDAKDSDSRFSWEASILYSVRSYSLLTLTTAQTNNETNGAGSYIASDYSALGWKHDFSPFISLVLDVSLANDEYVDDPDGRKDETVAYGVTGIYSPVKNIDVKLGYTSTERDSNISGLDYDKHIISLGVELGI